MAQSLDGYLWAVSSLKEEKMRVRCLEDSHQDLTKYSLIQQLNLPQLTAKELEETTQQTNSFATHDT